MAKALLKNLTLMVKPKWVNSGKAVGDLCLAPYGEWLFVWATESEVSLYKKAGYSVNRKLS